MGTQDACMIPDDKHFDDFKSCFKVEDSQVFFSGPCDACDSPYVCVPKKTPDDRDTFSYNDDMEMWEAHTGANGEAWTEIFMEPWPTYTRTMEGQCKWMRDDFDTFVDVTKDAQK